MHTEVLKTYVTQVTQPINEISSLVRLNYKNQRVTRMKYEISFEITGSCYELGSKVEVLNN